jgi:GntR family transcriptional repressor for pyruvate dehydrogenase complex
VSGALADGSERITLGDRLYGQILERIMSGALSIGDRLPSEKEISDGFGVSRPVVRQALLRLKADGLITTHQGLGSFVVHQPDQRIRKFAKARDVASYLRCHEVRTALEGETARLAALRRLPAQLIAIERAHQVFLESTRAGRMVAEEDLAFHRSIADASGNEFFLQALEASLDSMSGFMQLTLNLTRTGNRHRAQRVLDEHEAIVAAIRDEDGERARTAMQFHLGQARQRLTHRSHER